MFCDPPSCFARSDGCTSLGWEKNIRLTAPALFTEISDDAGTGDGGGCSLGTTGWRNGAAEHWLFGEKVPREIEAPAIRLCSVFDQ